MLYHWATKEAHSKSCCCCSVAQSCPTLCDPMDCSRPGFPVLHHLPELAQTHVLWVSDTIHPSCPLSFPSLPAFKFPQHQDIYQRVGSSNQVAKVLELQLQHQFISVQSFNHVWLFATPWTAAYQASLSITNFLSLLKLISIESVMPSNHLIFCHPLLLSSIFPSIIVFSNESLLLLWMKFSSLTVNGVYRWWLQPWN